MTRVIIGLVAMVVAVASSPVPARAQTVTLAWDASVSGTLEDGTPDPVAGYRVYAGETSRTYTTGVDVSNATTATVPVLATTGPTYFSVIAYSASGQQSGWSNEVSTTAPVVPCAFGLIGPPLPFGNGGGSVELILSASRSDCVWTAASSEPWLTVTPVAGIGAATLRVFISSNAATTARAGVVTVGAVSVTIQQEAAAPPPPPSDTTPPDVGLLPPKRSGNSNNYTVIVTSQATDVARADVYLDGVRVAGTLTFVSGYAPKVYIASRGAHEVHVELRDKTGNVGTASQTVTR